MGIGYNAIASINAGFKVDTALPFVGAVVNSEINGSVQSALNNSNVQLLPGDPVALTLPNNTGKNLSALSGYNFNNLTITKKATTTNTGSNDTAVCGFLALSSSDVALSQGNVPVSQKGVLANVCVLGKGAQMWLEVASANASGFQTTLDTNTAITIDSVSGGVKVGTAPDILVGVRVISGLQNAQKIKEDSGAYKVVPCQAILVEFI